MKFTYTFLILFILTAFSIQGCDDFDDHEIPDDIKVNDFIWKGLNQYYLWQADVPDLADSRFTDQLDLNNFLRGYSEPENLFQHLLNKPISQFPREQAIDRFSVIFSDYTLLEGILSGTTKNNGADYGLYAKTNSGNDIYGVIRYILPNSDAASKDIHRGDLFYAVNGTPLTRQNYSELLANETYTLNLADYNSGNFTPNGRSVTLTKSVISENPVYLSKVINSGSHKIGYLMYNGFYPNYETQLNDAFGQLKAAGITDFVLDLRYNSGGSVETATHLASMITGQFGGQVFAKEQWNAKVEDYYASHNPENLHNYFGNRINTGAAINTLEMNKIYVLTTASTASASELVINGLAPYITVIQIGDTTIGKNVGSITMYDSPTFSKKDISSKHRYAMQPLVLKIVNKNGFGDYVQGLQPNFKFKENLDNLGVLGDANEPYLNTAILKITGAGKQLPQNPEQVFDNFKDSKSILPFGTDMYKEKLPEGFGNLSSPDITIQD